MLQVLSTDLTACHLDLLFINILEMRH